MERLRLCLAALRESNESFEFFAGGAGVERGAGEGKGAGEGTGAIGRDQGGCGIE